MKERLSRNSRTPISTPNSIPSNDAPPSPLTPIHSTLIIPKLFTDVPTKHSPLFCLDAQNESTSGTSREP